MAFLCWQDNQQNELFGIPLRAVSAHADLPQLTGDDQFSDPGRITEILTGAGYVDVRVEPVTESARIGSDVADVVGYFTGPGRIRSLLAETADDTVLDQISATMAELFTPYARADGVWVTTAVWLVHARRPARTGMEGR